MSPVQSPVRDLALAMADFDAGHADYGDALRWLDVYAERGPLPAAYERKREAWARRAFGRRGLPPPALPPLGPPHD